MVRSCGRVTTIVALAGSGAPPCIAEVLVSARRGCSAAARSFLPPTPADAATPGFAPPGYRLVFGDEFDDPEVSRINENATGGRPGAPARPVRPPAPRSLRVIV